MNEIENIKILQLGKFYPIRGGVEKVMYDLMEGLSQKKIRCDMLCASTEKYDAGTFKINSYSKLIVVPTLMQLSATMLAPAMIRVLWKIARSYDIIHIHHPDPMAAMALFLSGFKGTVILHWHSDILKQKALLKLYAPLQGWLIKRADLIIGTTPIYVQKSPFLKKVQHKINYAPIGIVPVVPRKDKVEVIRAQYKDKILVFSLGRLVEYKGYKYLIQAAKRLDERFHFIIGGKGPLYDELSEMIKTLGLQERVSLIGFVKDDDVMDYYGAADIYCLSSIWKNEAFAIVQIEAMSCGKPIVSTKIPGSGVSWVNQHDATGITVNPQDPRALAEAILAIGNNDILYNRYALGSQKRYRSHFTREKMVEKCLKIYERSFWLRKFQGNLN